MEPEVSAWKGIATVQLWPAQPVDFAEGEHTPHNGPNDHSFAVLAQRTPVTGMASTAVASIAEEEHTRTFAVDIAVVAVLASYGRYRLVGRQGSDRTRPPLARVCPAFRRASLRICQRREAEEAGDLTLFRALLLGIALQLGTQSIRLLV